MGRIGFACKLLVNNRLGNRLLLSRLWLLFLIPFASLRARTLWPISHIGPIHCSLSARQFANRARCRDGVPVRCGASLCRYKRHSSDKSNRPTHMHKHTFIATSLVAQFISTNCNKSRCDRHGWKRKRRVSRRYGWAFSQHPREIQTETETAGWLAYWCSSSWFQFDLATISQYSQSFLRVFLFSLVRRIWSTVLAWCRANR